MSSQLEVPPTEQPGLETERLRLEPLTHDHAAEYFVLLSDPRIFEFIPQDPPPTVDAVEARFRILEKRRSPDGEEMWLNWVLRSKALGVCVGRVEVTVCQDRSAMLAYELQPEQWGQGFASEACGRVIETLFARYGVDRVVAEVDTRNTASIRLLERLGFERGFVKRDADFFKGASSDEVTYSLSRTSPA
jgi:RimJ/RimL family protein N-acetyltransferase